MHYNEEAEPGDETGFFFHDDPAQVDREMLEWMQVVANQVREMAARDGALNLQVNMPLNPAFLHPGAILTPLGPRSLEWVQRVAVDPSAGIDIFPWWEDGHSASMLLNRALCRMWEQVCWRAPMDDAEGELLLDIHNDLAAAYALDPTLPFPWREWAEVLDLLEEDESADEIETRIAETVREFAGQVPDSQPKVGYRRGTLRTRLPGQWSIELPGSLAETEDADGNWGALDADRQVWTAVLSLSAQDGQPVDREELLEALTALEHEEGEASTGGSPGPAPGSNAESYPLAGQPHVLGVASFTRHDDADEPYWELTGRAAVDGQALVLTVLIPSATDKAWALQVWNSIRHDPRPTSEEPQDDE
jgi:hypothetical protein